MLTLKIGADGATTGDLLIALDDIRRQLSEGHTHGYNYIHSESGRYAFLVREEEPDGNINFD